MGQTQSKLTVGLEEELFVVDPDTLNLVQELPKDFLKQCNQRFPGCFVPEFLGSQIECVSRPCDSVSELAEHYQALRQTAIDVAHAHGLAIYAASTHPFATWPEQTPNESKRYSRIANELQASARRMQVCGMHLHAGIEAAEQRLKILNRLTWYLPYFIALTSSSPFWQGHDMGFNSFRLNIIDNLPRSGAPPHFASLEAYQDYLNVMMESNCIRDPSEIWWDARLNYNFPTVECRVMDVCTRTEDAISVLAFYACLVHYLQRTPDDNFSLDLQYSLAAENRWRAKRYTIESLGLADVSLKLQLTVMDCFSPLLDNLKEDANALNCETELQGIYDILRRGTAADMQRQVFTEALPGGQQQALNAVVERVLEDTAG